MKDKLEFVSSIITNKEGNVLILKRENNLELDSGKYDLCSGHMKEGELPIQAIFREIREELGITQDDIENIENLGTLKTPHRRFLDTICHMYHVEINLTSQEINKRIRKIEKPEIKAVQYLEDINMLRIVQKYTNLMRTMYTDEVEKVLNVIMENENKRKEMDLCEER